MRVRATGLWPRSAGLRVRAAGFWRGTSAIGAASPLAAAEGAAAARAQELSSEGARQIRSRASALTADSLAAATTSARPAARRGEHQGGPPAGRRLEGAVSPSPAGLRAERYAPARRRWRRGQGVHAGLCCAAGRVQQCTHGPRFGCARSESTIRAAACMTRVLTVRYGRAGCP